MTYSMMQRDNIIFIFLLHSSLQLDSLIHSSKKKRRTIDALSIFGSNITPYMKKLKT
ncbi:hypothetical protein RchiOBHm_Chr7g0204051 [Rosa chinensis]|uniref:Uncharacterized protein n=1 Tax=Rosa chinensis TaxID=74649 RepID=A0A2P6P8L9_ROSCH|nr:hypothetical protein RchiOBHm_Chr7g0204051 [Rosa chinensis]